MRISRVVPTSPPTSRRPPATSTPPCSPSRPPGPGLDPDPSGLVRKVASHGGDAARPDGEGNALPARQSNTQRQRSGLLGVLSASPEQLDRLLHPALPGLGLLGVLDPLGIFLAMGERQPLEGLARRWILPEGPGKVIGPLELARLDVGLDPDPDPIPDPDPGGLL